MNYISTPSSAASPAASAPSVSAGEALGARTRRRVGALAARRPHPELLAVIALAGVLDLWDLSRNGYANLYYAAAVRSMSVSWHDFLFASMDRSGVMTVDKPPLALWVQALSVRVFGFHSLSILVPQALIGVASVALVYDLVRRRFGRAGGFVAGLTLALTPITVAISRHNNPDSLLVLCCVAALWCAARAIEPHTRHSTRWLVAAGVCVGLAFETKMLVALVVVPGIVAAWLWVACLRPSPGGPAASGPAASGPAGIAPAARGRLRALRQLLAGGAAMLIVGGAWPLLVELTPAADRPWISGTSDNTILSLIFEYNGLGRVDGQAGGPGGAGGGSVFGGATGPLRLLGSALGGQAGWLLGFALVGGLAILLSSRLRRADARSGWLLVVGGAFATTAVLFSFASGIFHPYYVSLLAPFAAALVGAGAAQLVHGRVSARVFGPLAVAGGVATELVVLGDYAGQLTWCKPVLIVVGLLAAFALLAFADRRVRLVAVGAALALLLVAPGVWAFDTLGHATSGTFPEGGPGSSVTGGGAPGFGGGAHGFGRGGPGAGAGGSGPGGPSAGAEPQLFGSGSGEAGASRALGSGQAGGAAGLGAGFGGGGRGFAGGGRGFAGGAIGAPIGGSVSSGVLSYVNAHGGGTIAVESQSNAASSIVEQDANVAGIGGFSGRESDVSISWLAEEVRHDRIVWVLEEEEAAGGGALGGLGFGGGAHGFGGASSSRAGGPPGETRQGSRRAMAAVRQACVAVDVTGSGESSSTDGRGGSALYDCGGRAAELERVGAQQSSS